MKSLVTKESCSVLVALAVVLVGPSWGDVKPMVKQTSDGVSYIIGGVGKDERAELTKLFKDYTFRIELANARGEYLYKARISILDSQGKAVLETDTCGPWLLVNLTEGQYTAVVVHEGKESKLKIAIEKGKKNVIIAHF